VDSKGFGRAVAGWWAEGKAVDSLLFPYLDGSLEAPTTAKVGVEKNARAAASPVLAAIVDDDVPSLRLGA
jgi:hypothetical protein